MGKKTITITIDDGEEFDPKRWEPFPKPIPKIVRPNSQKCLHQSCPNCHGTGVGKTGLPCVHALSCPCPRCTPYAMVR
jgi:hypothetical protein